MTTTPPAPSTDPFAVSPETEKEIFSLGGAGGGDSDFDGDEEELAAAFDGMFDDTGLLQSESCLGGAGSPFSLSDDELLSLGISSTATPDMKGLGYNLSEHDLNSAKKSAAQSIAETLASLPVAERERIVRDLYGISHNTQKDIDEENPALIQQKLEDFEKELARLRNSSSSWNLRLAPIELAESQNRTYVEDPKFRLKFLRADRYDARKAAARFIRFFDFKLELFGAEALARPITWSDLKPEDQATLKKGYIQRLPIRDRAGRAITISIYNGQVCESVQSVARMYFYIGCHSDDETDKKGNVHVFFKIKDFSFKQSPGAFGTMYVMRCIYDFPIRFEAYHKMLEKDGNRLMHKIVDYLTGFMAPEVKVRTKVHEGSHSDWVRDLMSFGIPHDVILFTQSFKIKTKNHLEYLAMRIKAEEILARNPKTAAETLIDLPTRSDVLLGKGKPIQFSSGNQRLMTVVDGYLDQYHKKCNKKEKTDLTNEIVQMLKESGVRFLSKDEGIWLEVPDDQARVKISYMFRHQRSKPNSSNGSDSLGIVRENPSPPAIADSTKRTRVEG